MTGDTAGTRFEPGGLLTGGDRIAWVGPREAAPEAARGVHVEVIDAARAIVMPGFVNAHLHSNESFEQGAYDNLPRSSSGWCTAIRLSACRASPSASTTCAP